MALAMMAAPRTLSGYYYYYYYYYYTHTHRLHYTAANEVWKSCEIFFWRVILRP